MLLRHNVTVRNRGAKAKYQPRSYSRQGLIQSPAGIRMPSADTIDPKFKTYIENTYSPIPRDQFEKIIDNYLTLIESAGERKLPLDAVLDQTCKIIFRLFGFREVLIGLKSRDDFHYRYVKLFGASQESSEVYRKIRYTTEDMISQEKFPHFKTGRLSELDPVEGLPEYEKELFTRKFQLGESRKSHDEFHEGDYMDFWVRGTSGDLVGWIEVLNPSDGKLPPRSTVRWIELLASILGIAISQRWADEDASKRK
jgi:hypothetical protein